jgi:hypothetical protein
MLSTLRRTATRPRSTADDTAAPAAQIAAASVRRACSARLTARLENLRTLSRLARGAGTSDCMWLSRVSLPRSAPADAATRPSRHLPRRERQGDNVNSARSGTAISRRGPDRHGRPL